ncbi:unnamed protein product, partial [Protopolystoma xenopodis]
MRMVDPVDAFEAALQGLATKDLDSESSLLPGENDLDSLLSNVKPAEGQDDDEFIQLLTGVRPEDRSSGALASSNGQPQGNQGGPQQDIIMSALINAGIAPSSLSSEPAKPKSFAAQATPRIIKATGSAPPSVKIFRQAGNPFVKIIQQPAITISNGHQTLRMASQLIRKPEIGSSPMPPGSLRVPNIIRKRHASSVDLVAPPTKVQRAIELSLPVSGVMQPSATTTLTNGFGDWSEHAKLNRFPIAFRNHQLSQYHTNIIKPFQMLRRDDDLDEDGDDLAQAETYADYVPEKRRLLSHLQY